MSLELAPKPPDLMPNIADIATNQPERPMEVTVAHDNLIYTTGSGRDSRSTHLTETGLYTLQQIVDDFKKKIDPENKQSQKILTINQAHDLVSFFESQYKKTKVINRTADQKYFAAAARLYRTEIKKAESSGKNKIDNDVFGTLTEKSKHNRTSLSPEGRHYVQHQLEITGCINSFGIMDHQKTSELVQQIETSSQSTMGAEARFKRLAAKSIEWKLDKQNEVDIYQSMNVSNSPWNEIIHTLTEAGFGGTKLKSESLLKMLLAPHVEHIFSKIKEFTSNGDPDDSLEESLITHTFAENLNVALQQLIEANPKILETSGVSELINLSLSVMADTLGEDLPVDQVLEIAVCKTRYLSEMPQFVIERSQQELNSLDNLLGKNDLNKFILEQIGALESNSSIVDIDFLKAAALARLKTSNPQSSPVDQLTPQPSHNIDQLPNENEDIINLFRTQLGNQFSRDQAIEIVTNLQSRREALILQINQDQEKSSYLQQTLSDVSDRESLADSLQNFWHNNENIDFEDTIGALLDVPWLPKDYRDYLVQTQNETRVAEEMAKQKVGLKEKLLKIGSSVSEKIKKLLKPTNSTTSPITERYQNLLNSRRQQAQQIVDSKDYEMLVKLETEEHIDRSRKVFKAINVSRIAMVAIGLGSGALGQYQGQTDANLRDLFEQSSINPADSNEDEAVNPLAHAIESLKDFFMPQDGLTIQGQDISNESNQDRIAALSLVTEVPTETSTATATATVEATATQTQAPTLEPSPTPETVAFSDTAEITQTPEVQQEVPTIFEFLLGEKSALHQLIVEARINHVESLPQDQRENYLNAIGGAENLNTTRICLGIAGEDNTSAEGTRPYKYGHADQVHLFCYDPDTNTLSDISFPRHLLLPEHEDGRYDVTATTWRDNPETQSNRSTPQGLDILQEFMVNVSGAPVETVISFNMDGAIKFIDAMFPDGIEYKIGEGEGFVPQGENLGKLSGYTTGGYNPFEEGKIYKFDGSQIVDFLRSRFTSEHGSYDREDRAGGILMRLGKIMFDQAKNDPVGTINNLLELTETINTLEESGGIRHNLDIEINKDPNTKSNNIADIMTVLTQALLTPASIAQMTNSISQHTIEAPKIVRYNISPYSDQEELRTSQFGEGTSSLIPSSQKDSPQFDQPLEYWRQYREFFQEKLFNEQNEPAASPTETEVVQGAPIKIMTLGDSQVSSGLIPQKIAQTLKDQNIEAIMVGGQDSGPSGSNGFSHEGHPSFTTRDVLRDLQDNTWNNYNGTEHPVQISETNPDVVVIQLGTNDAVDGGISTQETISNLQEISQYLRQINPNVKIVIGSIPPLSDSTATQRAEEINRLLPTLISHLNQNSDFPNSMVVFASHESIGQEDLGDGIHLNTTGQDELVENFVNKIID